MTLYDTAVFIGTIIGGLFLLLFALFIIIVGGAGMISMIRQVL